MFWCFNLSLAYDILHGVGVSIVRVFSMFWDLMLSQGCCLCGVVRVRMACVWVSFGHFPSRSSRWTGDLYDLKNDWRPSGVCLCHRFFGYQPSRIKWLLSKTELMNDLLIY